jgi:hypothetical protein
VALAIARRFTVHLNVAHHLVLRFVSAANPAASSAAV